MTQNEAILISYEADEARRWIREIAERLKPLVQRAHINKCVPREYHKELKLSYEAAIKVSGTLVPACPPDWNEPRTKISKEKEHKKAKRAKNGRK